MRSIKALQVLKCVCSARFKGKIFLCVSGHSVCEKCKISESCLVCKKKVENYRNLIAEEIINNASFECNHCLKFFHYQEIAIHITNCGTECFICEDKKIFITDKLIRHLITDHKIEFFIANEIIKINVPAEEKKSYYGFDVFESKVLLEVAVEKKSIRVLKIHNLSWS